MTNFNENIETVVQPKIENRKDKTIMYSLKQAMNVIENCIEGIIITDRLGNIESVNDSFCEITGYKKSEVIGKNPRILKSGLHDHTFYKQLWDTLEKENKWIGEFRNRKRDGTIFIQRSTICALRDEEGIVTSYAAVVADVTKAREKEEKLHSDLELAKQVQKSVLSKPLKSQHISIDGINIASDNLAGDMYAWYKINDHKYGIMLIDVMGHGVAASLVCMSILSLLKELICKVTDPNAVMKELNSHMRYLYSQHNGRFPYYFTSIYLVIDTKKKEIEYVNAGHPPAIIRFPSNDILQLSSTCTSIGFFEEIDPSKKLLEYNDKINILLYTDGLLNEEKPINEEIQKLTDHFTRISSCDSNSIISKLIGNDQRNRDYNDDVSIVSIQVR